jgi:uncharacterized protein YdaU (DUF1376 family)
LIHLFANTYKYEKRSLLFWAIIEILRETDGHKLKKDDLRTISYDLKVNFSTIEKVVSDYGLFKINGETISSKRLTQSMFEYNKRKEKFSEAGKRGNDIRWRSGGDGQVIALKERKGKGKVKGDFSPSAGKLDHNGNLDKGLEGMVY